MVNTDNCIICHPTVSFSLMYNLILTLNFRNAFNSVLTMRQMKHSELSMQRKPQSNLSEESY